MAVPSTKISWGGQRRTLRTMSTWGLSPLRTHPGRHLKAMGPVLRLLKLQQQSCSLMAAASPLKYQLQRASPLHHNHFCRRIRPGRLGRPPK